MREKGRSGALCSFLLFLLGLSRCFTVFSKEALRECSGAVSLAKLRLHPERYEGKNIEREEEGVSAVSGEIDGLDRLSRVSMAEQRGSVWRWESLLIRRILI